MAALLSVIELQCAAQAFVEDCRQMFDRMREAHGTEGTACNDGAEAMAETLEVIRKNEVQRVLHLVAVRVTAYSQCNYIPHNTGDAAAPTATLLARTRKVLMRICHWHDR